MSKYDPLHQHLNSLRTDSWIASFEDIERILGVALPKSAYKHSAWWANNKQGDRHSWAWLEAGWITENLNLMKTTVTFQRKERLDTLTKMVDGQKMEKAPQSFSEPMLILPTRWKILSSRAIKILDIMRQLTHSIKSLIIKFSSEKIPRFIALFWQHFYRRQHQFRAWQSRNSVRVFAATAVIYTMLLCLFVPEIQNFLTSYLLNIHADGLDKFQSFLLTLGGALIGGSAIAFSLVMFAMQVNVERMPHGLFKKFASDKQLIGAFILTLVLSVGVSFLAIFPQENWIGVAAVVATLATFTIFTLFLYAYKRALLLINPITQLKAIVKDSCENMRAWGKMAERSKPLLERSVRTESKGSHEFKSLHDTSRIAYFEINRHWTVDAKMAIQNIVSFYKRYAEHGDYEVSSAALEAIVVINQHYVKTKGKSFFANAPFIENPMVTDDFINFTLENLRQNVRHAISRGDEQLIEQNLKALALLVQIYVTIDYSVEHASKTHASLADGYLAEAILSIASHNMPDVLMEGVRLLGKTGTVFMAYGQVDHMAITAEKISMIGMVGIIDEKCRPVLLSAVEQLSALTIGQLTCKSTVRDIDHATQALKSNITNLTLLLLKQKDGPIFSGHGAYLGPYYSSTSLRSFPALMTELVNALANDELANDRDAKKVLSNVEKWADGLYIAAKQVLLAAVENKGNFVFDIIHWISHITKVLLAFANSPACDDHLQSKLQKHALWLVASLSWIPDTEEAITSVQKWSFLDCLFETALDAQSRGYEDISCEIQDIIFGWAFKAGKYKTGRRSFEDAIYALAALVLLPGKSTPEALVEKIVDKLAKPEILDNEVLEVAARGIHRKASEVQQVRYSIVDNVMRNVDQSRKSELLYAIAHKLSPASSNRENT